MAALGCSVNTCGYNAENCCCRNEINVKGTKADHSDDTCCSSFRKDNSDFKNAVMSPKESLHISCDAVTCRYNDSQICQASHIDIAGSSADEQGQTLCSTFTSK